MTITFRTTHDDRGAAGADRRLRRFGRRSGDSLRLRIDLCLADVGTTHSLDAPRTATPVPTAEADAELQPSYWNEFVSA